MGSLKDFLWAGNPKNTNESTREQGLTEAVHYDREFPIWAAQVASAMIYLGCNNIVHRHLSASNVMMTSKLIVKVKCTSFCRLIPTDTKIYKSLEQYGQDGANIMKWWVEKIHKIIIALV